MPSSIRKLDQFDLINIAGAVRISEDFLHTLFSVKMTEQLSLYLDKHRRTLLEFEYPYMSRETSTSGYDGGVEKLNTGGADKASLTIFTESYSRSTRRTSVGMDIYVSPVDLYQTSQPRGIQYGICQDGSVVMNGACYPAWMHEMFLKLTAMNRGGNAVLYPGQPSPGGHAALECDIITKFEVEGVDAAYIKIVVKMIEYPWPIQR